MAARIGNVERIRRLALALPEATEELTWGDVNFRVRTKIFCFPGETGLTVKADPDELQALLGDPRFARRSDGQVVVIRQRIDRPRRTGRGCRDQGHSADVIRRAGEEEHPGHRRRRRHQDRRSQPRLNPRGLLRSQPGQDDFTAAAQIARPRFGRRGFAPEGAVLTARFAQLAAQFGDLGPRGDPRFDFELRYGIELSVGVGEYEQLPSFGSVAGYHGCTWWARASRSRCRA